MRLRICESAGSNGESVNLHPVTRLASDLGRTRQKYHRTVQKYVCTVQYLDGLRQFSSVAWYLLCHFAHGTEATGGQRAHPHF